MHVGWNSRDAKVKVKTYSVKYVTKPYAGRGNYNFLKIALFKKVSVQTNS